MIELAVFDMAGTTIDDHGLVYEALRGSVEETGASVAQAELQLWMGTDKVSAINALMRLGGVEPVGEAVHSAFGRFRALLAEFYAGKPPIALPGVETALQTLRGRGIKIALTTGFDNEVAYPLLDSLGWAVGPAELLDAVVTTSDVRAGRPAPYMIHRAMERTSAQDVRAVLSAGDTLVDVQAANQGGVLSVGVLTGSLSAADFAPAAPDYVLSSAAEVPSLSETQPDQSSPVLS